MRARNIVPAGVHVEVAGSNMSAARLAVLASSLEAEPPRASTLPLGSRTAFICTRGADIGGRLCQAGVGCESAMIPALAVAFPEPPGQPPMIMMRARHVSDGLSGRRTD